MTVYLYAEAYCLLNLQSPKFDHVVSCFIVQLSVRSPVILKSRLSRKICKYDCCPYSIDGTVHRLCTVLISRGYTK